MRTSLFQIGRLAVVAVPLISGCASMSAPRSGTHQRTDYAPEAFARIRDSLITRRVSQGSGEDAPRVRIIPPSVRAANTVDAKIEVSRDAYVLVVATDLDGQVRVVFPESPSQSGFLRGSTKYKLPEFFGGFGPLGLAQYGRSPFSVEPVNRYAALGSIVAIASDRPLQLTRITTRGGEWDEPALERLVYGRSPTSAGYSLGTELTLADNGFDTAFSGFSQAIGSSLSVNASVGASLCESGFARSPSSNNSINAMYFDGPRTTFSERDGIRYATTVTGNPCTGFQSRTIPVGPALPPTTGDSASGARVPAADPRLASARAGNGTQGLRPSDRPSAVPQRRDTDANVRAQSENERERARVDAAERASRRPMTPTAQQPMPEPMRREPPQVREAPPAPAPAPSEPPAGKPKKE